MNEKPKDGDALRERIAIDEAERRDRARRMRSQLFTEGARLEDAYRGYVGAVALVVAAVFLAATPGAITGPRLVWAIALYGALRWGGLVVVGIRASQRVEEIKKDWPL